MTLNFPFSESTPAIMFPVGFQATWFSRPETGVSLTDCTNPLGSGSGLAALLNTLSKLSLTKDFLDSVPLIPKLMVQNLPSGFQLILDFSPNPSSSVSFSGI